MHDPEPGRGETIAQEARAIDRFSLPLAAKPDLYRIARPGVEPNRT